MEIPKDATDREKEKINKKNGRIEKRNEWRMENAQTKLNEVYNGSDGKGSQNSSGETVKFKLNFIGVETSDLTGGTNANLVAIATEHSLKSSSKNGYGEDVEARAAVITEGRSTSGKPGASNGICVEVWNGTARAYGHKLGHTFHLNDNPYIGYNKGLMDYSGGNSLIPSEVDEIWNKAYDK